jgi:ribonuclease HII
MTVQRTENLLTLERALWGAGRTRVAGVDEAGVGPLAGPVVAAAVVFGPGRFVRGVRDSKALSPARRERLAGDIVAECLAFAYGIVEPEEIDRLNIYRASLEAMRRAVESLAVRPDHVLVDARTIPSISIPQEGIVRGDAICHAIAAASILAKVFRDAAMAELDDRFPGYGFRRHKGYPTVAHREAIRRMGPCPVHRKSFRLG